MDEMTCETAEWHSE